MATLALATSAVVLSVVLVQEVLHGRRSKEAHKLGAAPQDGVVAQGLQVPRQGLAPLLNKGAVKLARHEKHAHDATLLGQQGCEAPLKGVSACGEK